VKVPPSLDELEIELSTGSGIAIIVEGNSYEDDPWFYGQWFGDRAREVTFYPQNGWHQVVAAMNALRERSIGVPVYGAIDRDFCEDNELDAEFESKGILRTPRYTLENHLLDPACWATVFKRIFIRNPTAARGWDDEQRVTNFISDAYRDCLALTAHNWVVGEITVKYASPTTPSRDYLTNHRAVKDKEAVLQSLANWGASIGASEDLRQLFDAKLAQLGLSKMETLSRRVSGKYVLERLLDMSPGSPNKNRYPLVLYLNLYMESCSTPPADMVNLIERIIKHAGR
jgi:hypothetical protein